jgi:spore coat protein E
LSSTDRVLEYRQIITKAVCGKGRKFSTATHSVQPPDNIYAILGAWVINHNHETTKIGETVEVRGSYDINIWYSTRGNTKTDVIKETVHYSEQVPLGYYDHNTMDSTTEVKAAVTQVPNCVEASISSVGDSVVVKIEKEFMVEMVGHTKICVPVYPLELAEFDDKEIISGMPTDYSAANQFDDLDPELLIDDLD